MHLAYLDLVGAHDYIHVIFLRYGGAFGDSGQVRLDGGYVRLGSSLGQSTVLVVDDIILHVGEIYFLVDSADELEALRLSSMAAHGLNALFTQRACLEAVGQGAVEVYELYVLDLDLIRLRQDDAGLWFALMVNIHSLIIPGGITHNQDILNDSRECGRGSIGVMNNDTTQPVFGQLDVLELDVTHLLALYTIVTALKGKEVLEYGQHSVVRTSGFLWFPIHEICPGFPAGP